MIKPCFPVPRADTPSYRENPPIVSYEGCDNTCLNSDGLRTSILNSHVSRSYIRMDRSFAMYTRLLISKRMPCGTINR